jgi:glycosyltransferase involved in cell wall biosynthesis
MSADTCETAAGGPEVSVVIPTLNRRTTLQRLLQCISEQQAPEGGFEVVVVDNGSTDGTADLLERVGRDYSLPFRHAHEPRPGPAVARNTGVRNSSGEVILFLGDDTEPQRSDLVARHAELHRRRPERSYAVLGRVTWDPRRPITPFMRWLENGGPQFHYWRIRAGAVDPAYYFYTAQLSLKRAVFDAAGGFDERFPFAALEDIEFGIRMSRAGVELDYHPELLVLHDHPTALARTLTRLELTGRSAALYHELFPHRPHDDFVQPFGPLWRLLLAGEPLLRLACHRPFPLGLRQRGWHYLHRAAYGRGYRKGPPPTAAQPGPLPVGEPILGP